MNCIYFDGIPKETRIGADERNPYTQDLFLEHERIAKVALWRKLADEGKDSEYNALDIPSD